MAKVKCSECGFISARDWDTRQFTEMDDKKRSTGKIGNDFAGFEPAPVCFINSFNIKEEVETLRKAAHDEPTQDSVGGHISPHWDIHAKAILHNERECKSFTKWQQGFTPKEHKEMVDRESRDRFEAEQRMSDRRWHIVELIITLAVGAIIALLSAFISQGWSLI